MVQAIVRAEELKEERLIQKQKALEKRVLIKEKEFKDKYKNPVIRFFVDIKNIFLIMIKMYRGKLNKDDYTLSWLTLANSSLFGVLSFFSLTGIVVSIIAIIYGVVENTKKFNSSNLFLLSLFFLQ